MTSRSALAMSQTKDELLRHLNLDLDTYSKMAKETDHVYKWLVADRQHLKKSCKKDKSPYDWSDLLEKSKDKAMERLANSSDADTRYYWGLAFSTFECPNWIARWFLYHVFRYRDGRNRGGSKTHNDQTKSPRNSKSSAHKHTRDKDNPAAERSSQQGNGALISGSEPSPCTHEYSSVECFTSTSEPYKEAAPPWKLQYVSNDLYGSPVPSIASTINDPPYPPRTTHDKREYWDPIRDAAGR